MKLNFTSKKQHSKLFRHICALLLLCVTVPVSLLAQTVTVGTGTTTTSTSPIASCYGYTYSQQIYTAAEILAANGGAVPNGQIINVRFHLSTSSFNSGSASSNIWTVYIGDAATATFASNTAWIPLASMTQVFSGTVTFPSFGNWMTIPLQVPYTWNGTSDLVVAVDENQPSWDCTMSFTGTSTSANYRSIYYYSDGTNPNPASPPTGTRTYTRPNIQLQWAMPCTASGVTFPSTGTVTASPVSICLTGNTTLTFTPASTMPSVTGLTYKWQTATAAGGPWTDIAGAVTTAPTYTTTVPLTASAYFRCVVLCNGTTTILNSAASAQVVVNNPGVATGVSGSRCGPGSVALSASGPAGTTLRWYENPTGGSPLFVGANFNTPYITNTRNYYVSAGTAPSPMNVTVGAGALTPSYNYVTIFAGGWGGYKHQFLISEAELTALGLSPGATINSIGVDNLNGTSTYNGFTVSFKSANINALNTTFETGTVPAFGPVNYTTTLGVNTFTLTTPYIWTGGGLIIETCWSNGGYSNTYSNLAYDNTSYASTHYGYQDNATPATVCAITSGGSTVFQRPKFIINADASCQGNRTAVIATINPSTAVPKTFPPVVCNDAVATIALTSPSPAYPSYNWSSDLGGDLFTNAAGTTAYTGGSFQNMYLRSTTPGVHTVYMMAGNPTLTTGCTYADTFRIHVQPGAVAINATPDTICVTGTSTLKLNPIEPYYAGSIQWYNSTNNTVYNNIAGATNATYTTPVLAYGNNTYYKAEIKAGNAICQAPTKYIVIANPQLVSAADGFNCGPGSVTLSSVTAGNGSPVWYDVPSGGSPIGTGSPWNTPYLAQTTSYYVAANGGGSEGVGILGAGSTTSSDTYMPFYHGWGGAKNQYLITTAQLLAAGLTPGTYLVSLGFDVTSIGTGAFQNFAIGIKNTNLTALVTPFQTGFVEVLAPATTNLTVGVNTFTFNTPYLWDGGNIIVQTCYSNNNYGGSSATLRADTYTGNHNLYGYGDSQPYAALCGGNPTNGPYTSNYRPKMLLGYNNKCESPRQLVTASIYPKPVVDLGADINKCIDAGEGLVLDAGVQPNTPQYMWDNGSTSQVRSVFASGAYYATVTNEFTCATTDTVNITFRPNPVVNLGADTSICEDLQVTLNAGNDGIQYYWNTGATTPTIVVNAAGDYYVFVTNAEGCYKSDTIHVNTQGLAPKIDGIYVNNNGINTFKFTAVNPQNIIGYEWDFGDHTPFSYQESPTHTYENSGNYLVRLTLSSTCGFVVDSSSAHILPNGLDDINADQSFTVYPNPTTESATIANQGSLTMEHITVFNVLGQKVISQKAQSATKHQISLHGVASGIYTIQITTDKGNVTRKLEIIK